VPLAFSPLCRPLLVVPLVSMSLLVLPFACACRVSREAQRRMALRAQLSWGCHA